MLKITKSCFFAVFSIALVASMFFSCASTPYAFAPDWIAGSQNSASYPADKYFTAVGSGETLAVAESDASAALTKIIRQTVDSRSVAAQSYVGAAAGSELQTQLLSKVDTTSNVTISGMSIAENYCFTSPEDKSTTYYALAVVNREKTGTVYRDKILQNNEVIARQCRIADSLPGTLEAYAALQGAISLAAENEDYLDILSVVNIDMWKKISVAYGNLAALAEKSRLTLDAIHVAVVVDGDSDGRVGAAFTKVMKNFGISHFSDSADGCSYVLKAFVSFVPLDMTSSSHKYVRYIVDASFVDCRTGRELVPFSINGREAHLTESEADQLAVRTVESEIAKKFGTSFNSLFVQ
ncbi:MAG: LPP20 family lipoprotein [Treponemataceae bacterium]|nr:LPP20 family lipoprotein [Treponemataceae bacterium]